MKIAITGGTGFVGRHLARKFSQEGHEVTLIARGHDHRDESIRALPGITFVEASVSDEPSLRAAFAGCDAVAHCAGINREIGTQTYQRVHIDGTRNVVNAANASGVQKIILLSFLRARPHCRSGYHESKWAAEEIVRASGLDYTILKPGVIYGHGDHMLDHLSHALHTLPLFALVGMKSVYIRPIAIDDLVTIIRAAIIGNRLSRETVFILGPEELTLKEAARRVGRVIGKSPICFPMPVWFHYILGWICERLMEIPLVSLAQVRILSEGVTEPSQPCNPLPHELLPQKPFDETQIRNGLPAPGGFGWTDLRLAG